MILHRLHRESGVIISLGCGTGACRFTYRPLSNIKRTRDSLYPHFFTQLLTYSAIHSFVVAFSSHKWPFWCLLYFYVFAMTPITFGKRFYVFSMALALWLSHKQWENHINGLVFQKKFHCLGFASILGEWWTSLSKPLSTKLRRVMVLESDHSPQKNKTWVRPQYPVL
jgi:hypothetical protein